MRPMHGCVLSDMHCSVAGAGRQAKKVTTKPPAAPRSVSLQLQHSMQGLTVGAAAPAVPELPKAEDVTVAEA